MSIPNVEVPLPEEDTVIVQPEITESEDVLEEEKNETSETIENEETENNETVDTETTDDVIENEENNDIDNELSTDEDVETDESENTEIEEDKSDNIIDNENNVVDDTTSFDENPVVDNSNNTEEVTEEKEYLKPSGDWYNIDPNEYTEYEIYLITEMLKGIETIKNTNESICVKIDVTDLSNTSNLYYKLSSFFYVYYGQEKSKDYTFDMVNKTVNGVRSAYIQLRGDDIKELEANLVNIRNEIDEMLAEVIVGSEEEMMKQIALMVVDKIEYTYGYSDVPAALDGKSVCNGYALLFNMMCNRAGIKSDVCIGKVSSGEYHAWNRVTLNDGSYRYVDTTWADTGNRNSKYLNSKKNFHGSFLINNYMDCWFRR